MPNRAYLTCALVALMAIGASRTTAAEFQLNAYYTDHMVLQRDKPATISGTATGGATVTVTFAGQTRSAKAAADGSWAVRLDAMPANAAGADLTVKSDGKTLRLRDVVVGDVILYARQTSIDVSLGSTAEGKKAAKSHKADSNLRAISIRTIAAKQPMPRLSADATEGWSTVDSAGASRMSAAAFYLGRDLIGQVDVPVGIVDLNMGAYFAIGWLSNDALESAIKVHGGKELRWQVDSFKQDAEDRDSGAAQRELDEYYAQQVEKARGRPVGPKPSLGIHPMENPQYPSGGYNAVIHPLRHVEFRAVVLQHGADYPYLPYRRLAQEGLAQNKAELDAAWAQNYMIMKVGYRSTAKTMPDLIGDWRTAFGDADLPIGLVAPPASDLDAYAKHNREMREMHRRMALDNDHVGLILPGMENVDFSGQPADEPLLARRSLLWLLGDVYDKPGVVASGPKVDRVDAHLANAVVHFKPGTAEGLKATGDALNHFEVAAPGGEFMPATATVDGNTIKLHCAEVGQIAYVRFNWQNVPDAGLVNSAGLPALPFNTDDRWQFAWYAPDKESELPEEYFTTADAWGDNDVAIINGEIDYLASGDSEPIPRRPGPLGIYSAPFGPNIYVISIDAGTPAVGKLLPGDFIFGVNGEKFSQPGDPVYKQLSAAITHAESEAGRGKLVCMVRRGKKIMDVTLQLAVLGTYSPTSPYYCQKTENLITRAKQWSAKRFRPESGSAKTVRGMLGTDLWFLMASGDPAVQGLVRRAIYEDIAKPIKEADPYEGMHNWSLGYSAILLGEYYHATGDRNVLAHLKNKADWGAVTQIKAATDEPVPWEVAQHDMHVGGYRQRYNPQGKDRWMSGYGLMPPAGTAVVSGMIYAKEAGLEVDEEALANGIRHFRYQRAEHAFVEYLYWGLRTDSPASLDPKREAAGMLWNQNGKLGQAAAMFRVLEDHQVVEICSRYCVYSYNQTRSGHGGMFFNNLWTPIGAHASGPKGYKHFMQGQTWWRELYRRNDGSYNQVGRGGIGVAYALHYVAPLKRMRILGAPQSAFGTAGAAKDYLQPAIAAHRARDYARCEQLLIALPDEVAIPPEDQPLVDHFLESVQILRKSIEHDLAYVERCLADGNYDYAAVEIPQLKGVVAADNPRLKAILAKLDSPDVKNAMRRLAQQRRAEDEAYAQALQEALPPRKRESWVCLTPDRSNTKANAEPATWRMKLLEDRVQSPDGWDEPGFDDSSWDAATMPISWAMYHTVLFRGKFNVDDKSKFDKLRFRGGFFQQGNVMVYINGELVAKVDNIGRGAGMSDGLFTDYAVELLKNGENTVAITTRHKRRWGPLRGKYTTAAGFTFMLDAREKQ